MSENNVYLINRTIVDDENCRKYSRGEYVVTPSYNWAKRFGSDVTKCALKESELEPGVKVTKLNTCVEDSTIVDEATIEEKEALAEIYSETTTDVVEDDPQSVEVEADSKPEPETKRPQVKRRVPRKSPVAKS